MFGFSELQVIWGVVIAIWVILGLLVVNMLLERLFRDLPSASRQRTQQGPTGSRVASVVRGRGSRIGLRRGRPAYEGRSRKMRVSGDEQVEP